MTLALSDYVILGVETPLVFLKELLNHPAFISAELHTGFLPEHFPDWKNTADEDEKRIASIAAAVFAGRAKKAQTSGESTAIETPWQTLGGWEMS